MDGVSRTANKAKQVSEESFTARYHFVRLKTMCGVLRCVLVAQPCPNSVTPWTVATTVGGARGRRSIT